MGTRLNGGPAINEAKSIPNLLTDKEKSQFKARTTLAQERSYKCEAWPEYIMFITLTAMSWVLVKLFDVSGSQLSSKTITCIKSCGDRIQLNFLGLKL